MIGTLNRSQIDEVLNRQVIGRIGYVSGGRTRIAPVTYAYDDKSIYWVVPKDMDIQELGSHQEVCFEVELMNGMGNWKYVTAWGACRPLEGREELTHALALLAVHLHGEKTPGAGRLTEEWPFPTQSPLPGGTEIRVVKLDLREGHFETFESEGAKVHVC
jgi:nitroimidazol reductase NimA-like FMN-containing flavoprotein (pyridoxamine 5'-phosphate oxidase superfamily)